MPKNGQAEALNVSGAFDNCFFHTYILHLLANNLPLPQDLFTFNSIEGENSAASEIQKRFSDIESLSLFEEYSIRHHPEKEPVSSSFIYEKTLVLGFLMREWFATTMSTNKKIRNSLTENMLDKFKIYKEFRISMDEDDLLSGEEGVLYLANQEFLEYYVEHPKQGLLTEKEERFKQYFTDANEDVDLALKNYWNNEGYANYCQLIAESNTKLSYVEIVPVLKMLEQPLTIYSAIDQSIITQIPRVEDFPPELEVNLNALEGHYFLLKTELTTELLNEYERSSKQYIKEREEVHHNEVDKIIAANEKSSLLVGAICSAVSLPQPPFTVLLEKIDTIKEFVQNDKERERQQLLQLEKEHQAREEQTHLREQLQSQAQQNQIQEEVQSLTDDDHAHEIDVQTLAAIEAVENSTPKATEGFVARMVNAIKALWEGIKNVVEYIGQKLGIVN